MRRRATRVIGGGRGPWGRAADAALVLAATAAAAWSFWPVYEDPSFVLAAAVALAVGAAIAAGGAWRRWPSAVVVPASALAYLLLGVPLALPDEALGGLLPSGSGLALLLRLTAAGWRRLVTVAPPVGDYEGLLVPVFLLVLSAAVVATTVSLRASRPRWALTVPLALFGAGVALGPGVSAVPVASSLGLTVLVLAGLARLGPPVGGRSRVGRLVAAALVVVVAGTAGTAAALLAPGEAPKRVVRDTVRPPFDPADHASPLASFRAYLEEPRASEPMLRVRGLAKGERIEIAILDSYDGVVYAAGGDAAAFARAPALLGRAEDSEGLAVRISGYRGVWLPSGSRLSGIDFEGGDAARLRSGLVYNDASGTAAIVGGVRKGDRYRVSGAGARTVPIASLARARPGGAPLPSPAVVPRGLDARLRAVADPSEDPGRRLVAALDDLREHGYLSHGLSGEPRSRSGHGADRITELLTSSPMVGDQEQYSVAAALLARRIGFPARVVVGFVPPEHAGRGAVTLTGSDFSAWMEVQTRDRGWVQVDPTPDPGPVPEREREKPKQVSRPQTVVPPPKDDVHQPDDTEPPSRSRHRSAVEDGPSALVVALRVSAAVLIVAALLATPLLVVLATKASRRRRRNRGSERERVLGAWREVEDAALDHGRTAGPGATRTERALGLGGAPPLVVALAADRAAFSPDGPEEGEADLSWSAVRETRERLGAGRGRFARLRAALSLRSLRGRRRARSRYGGGGRRDGEDR